MRILFKVFISLYHLFPSCFCKEGHRQMSIGYEWGCQNPPWYASTSKVAFLASPLQIYGLLLYYLEFISNTIWQFHHEQEIPLYLWQNSGLFPFLCKRLKLDSIYFYYLILKGLFLWTSGLKDIKHPLTNGGTSIVATPGSYTLVWFIVQALFSFFTTSFYQDRSGERNVLDSH